MWNFLNKNGSEVVNCNWLSDPVLCENNDTIAKINEILVDSGMPIVAWKEMFLQLWLWKTTMIIAIKFNSRSKAYKYYEVATANCMVSLQKNYKFWALKFWFQEGPKTQMYSITAFKESLIPWNLRAHVKNKTKVNHSLSKITINWYSQSHSQTL